MRRIVEIDDKMWEKFREGDAFDSDEEALAYLIATVVTTKGPHGRDSTTTQLALAAQKVKVLPCP